MAKIQKIGVTAFITKGNKALIVKRSEKENFLPGYWELPGGKVEFGESPEDALKREIKEELNLHVKPIGLYSTFSYTSKSKEKHTIDLQYFVELEDKIENLALSPEHIDHKFMAKDEISNFRFSEEMKKVIIKGFNHYNNKI